MSVVPRAETIADEAEIAETVDEEELRMRRDEAERSGPGGMGSAS